MPAHVAYPTDDDLETYLRGLNLFTAAQLAAALPYLALDEKVAASSAEWERVTGWRPFLAGVTEIRRLFDPPGPNRGTGTRGGGTFLILDQGLVVLAAVHTDVVPATTPSGTALVIEDDYRLWPYNAAWDNQPYTAIEFVARRYALAKTIGVTGLWGYTQTLPDDVWQAILQHAAGIAFAELRERRTGGMIEWKQAETSERYGEHFLEASEENWRRRFERAAMRYQRVLL